MENKGNPVTSETRRDVLKGIGAASVWTVVGGAFPATASGETNDPTLLGDFESGLDGWEGLGNEALGRVETPERPVAVTRGNYGLQVTTTDELRAGIANESRVADADFVENPYLFATVTPGQVFGTDSAAVVQFRLHYASNGLLGDDLSVVESTSATVRPHVASVLTWDLSGIDEAIRSNAVRLEIAWYPEADLSTDVLLGDDAGAEWTTVFDDVHLSDDRERYELVRMADHWERLKFANGTYQETRILSRDGGVETGEFVFGDGVAIPYSIERLSSGGTEYVIDGVTYLLGGEL